MASGLLIWGQTVLHPHLGGFIFLVYWAVCLGFTLASIFLAFVDARVMLRNIKMDRVLLAKRAKQGIELEDARQRSNIAESTISN